MKTQHNSIHKQTWEYRSCGVAFDKWLVAKVVPRQPDEPFHNFVALTPVARCS